MRQAEVDLIHAFIDLAQPRGVIVKELAEKSGHTAAKTRNVLDDLVEKR